MFTLTITEKGGEQKRLEFDKTDITIGRVPGNDVVLPKGNVSKKHSRILYKDGKFIIVDLKSTNGTYVNGRKIASPLVLKDSDKIYVGDFILAIEGAPGEVAEPVAEPVAEEAPPRRAAPPPPPRRVSQPQPMPPPLEAEEHDEPEEMDAGALEAAEAEEDDEEEEEQTGAPAPSRPAAARREEVPTPAAPVAASPQRRPEPSSRMAPSGQPFGGRDAGASASLPPAPEPRRAPPPVRPSLPTPAAPMPVAQPSQPSRRSPTPAALPAVASPGAPSAAMSAAPSASLRAPAPTPFATPAAALPNTSLPTMVGAAAADAPPRPATLSSPESRAAQAPRASSFVTPPPLAILDRLVGQLDGVRDGAIADGDQWKKARKLASDLLLDSDGGDPEGLVREALGLGPLEDLLADPEVDEITVLRADQILVARAGRAAEPSPASFSSEASLARIAGRLAVRAGRSFDGPLCHGRIAEGWRVTSVRPPAAARGTLVVLTREATRPVATLDELARQGVLPAAAADWLARSLAVGRTVAVSGRGAERLSLLGALAATLPREARVVSIEEIAELRLPHARWFALDASAASGEERDREMGRLLSLARGFRPDRLVLGLLRPDDALAVIDTLAAGPLGSLLVLDGDSTRDALVRLERSARRRATDGATYAVREQIAQAIHVVVQMTAPQGGARVTQMSEVLGLDQQGYALRDLPL